MRWKFERDNLQAYKCCFCCHVRTGTLFLGLFHLLAHVAVLSAFIVFVLRPDLLQSSCPCMLQSDVVDLSASVANTTSTASSMSIYENQLAAMYNREMDTESKLIGVVLTLGSLTITVCLIYGTLTGRSQYITPFFCLQVFDLCITGMMMLSYFSDMPDLKKWVKDQKCIPFKDEIVLLDNDHLMLMALVLFVLVLSVKMYFIGIVWSCYKYLKQYERVGVGLALARDYDTESVRNPEDTEMLLPPKYEDVIRMPVSDAPSPPAYTLEE